MEKIKTDLKKLILSHQSLSQLQRQRQEYIANQLVTRKLAECGKLSDFSPEMKASGDFSPLQSFLNLFLKLRKISLIVLYCNSQG